MKKVKKIDENQLSNISEVVNKIFILRHKLRMLWWSINKDENEELQAVIDEAKAEEESKGETHARNSEYV